MTRRLSMVLLAVFCLAVLSAATTACRKARQKGADAFAAAEEAWRAERDEGMKAPTSWLTIAGLFWLEEGENPFGTAEGNSVRLPEGSGPDFGGKFILSDGRVKVEAAEGVPLKIGGERISSAVLKSDKEGNPDVVSLNDLRMWIIVRGDRLAVRLRDMNAPAYRNYAGLEFFPPDPAYRVEGKFLPYPEPKKVVVPTVIGTEAEMNAVGIVKFRIQGVDCELEAFEGGRDRLFFIFRDGTSGGETYAASRFMAASVTEEGKVDLNFNRAYNPPCAYTPYATCPLPPEKNILQVRIEAGEKAYPGGRH